MKQFKNFFLIALMVLVGGVASSCGSDDDDNGGGIDTYTLKMRIADSGNLPAADVELINQTFNKYSAEIPNTTLAAAKLGMNEAMELYISSGALVVTYDYTIEYYLLNSSGKTVYSRKIVVKDGKATAQ